MLRVGRTAVIALLAVVVVAAGVLLAVPQAREAVLPTAPTTTRLSAPPPGWRPPSAAPVPALPLEPLTVAAAPPAKALQARLATLAKAAAASPAVVVLDGLTGRTLMRRSSRAMVPASTMKLLTALAALEGLGPSRTFSTAVVGAGKGTIVLRGGGDPLLRDARGQGRASLQQLAEATAAALLRSGVRSVVLGFDGSLFTGPAWHPHWSDNYRYSVAPVTALAVDGSSRADGLAEKDPARSAAAKFAARLTAAGVKVSRIAPSRAAAGAQPLAAVSSPPVEQIVEHLLRQSDNLTTEVLGRHVGLALRGGGSYTDARAAVKQLVGRLKVAGAGLVIDDVCGLSRDNRVSPDALAAAVRLAVAQPRFRALLAGLPVAGVSGTLWDRFDDRQERAGRGVVRAKTGSLRDVSSLAGYLVTADNAVLVFAIMTNAVTRPFAVRDWMDRTTAAWAACGCG